MSRLYGMAGRLSPLAVVRSLRRGRVFRTFADLSGLISVGGRELDGESNAVRGFTASTGAYDTDVVLGSIAGHETAIVRRSVSHSALPHERSGHTHSWLIGAVFPGEDILPDVLALSHAHGRLMEEAAHIHRHHERHLSINPTFDANFLMYAGSTDGDRLEALFGERLTGIMLQYPSYDYEFTTDALYVYDQTDNVTPARLRGLLAVTLAVANAVTAA